MPPESPFSIEVLDDADRVAHRAAAFVAAEARAAVSARGRFVLAVSGGTTPWQMLRALADEDVPWSGFHIVQVDERVAPPGDTDRNLTHLRASLLEHAPLPAGQIYPMPVEDSDLADAAARYAKTLEQLAGSPPVLIPGDPVLDVHDADVATTGVYQGRRRVTLTYPLLNRARRILWLVTGGNKAEMLRRLREADSSIPAGRVRNPDMVVLADRAAAALV